MADPTLYTYPSPLEGYRNLEPLPKSVYTQQCVLLSTDSDEVTSPRTASPLSILQQQRRAKHTAPSCLPFPTIDAEDSSAFISLEANFVGSKKLTSPKCACLFSPIQRRRDKFRSGVVGTYPTGV
jgi:hypothetical protein